jgi:hypothetical protein
VEYLQDDLSKWNETLHSYWVQSHIHFGCLCGCQGNALVSSPLSCINLVLYFQQHKWLFLLFSLLMFSMGNILVLVNINCETGAFLSQYTAGTVWLDARRLGTNLNHCHSNILVYFFPIQLGLNNLPTTWRLGVFQHPHPSTTHPFSTTLDCSGFYKMECREYERIWESRQMQLFQQGWIFTNDQKGPVHLRILLHYWGKQRAYWGKCPSSYIVKKCPAVALTTTQTYQMYVWLHSTTVQSFIFICSNPLEDIPLSVFLPNFSTTYDVIA